MTLHTFEMDSPLGHLRGAVTHAGLAVLALPGSAFDEPVARLGADATLDGARTPVTERIIAALEAYFFAGDADLDHVAVDLSLVRPFAREVLVALRDVPRGSLTTYGALAERIGRAGAARAVGGAVGSNPVPLVVPCHRVIATDGRLGGFSAGLPAKRALLEFEGHAVDGDAAGRWSRARVRSPRTDQRNFTFSL